MSDITDLRNKVIAFARDNLLACAEELVEWHDSAILRDGKVRELAAMCAPWVGADHSLRVAESFVHRQALEFVRAAAALGEQHE